ncbi:FxsB family cyclophane-forming radical SAM/SPASM peptide maturase [Streptomyces sp. NBC_00140]|uniref:FxsB family cyclophane-forming radical SAM/SPASM peptide maturase n=1 Tax=Streptomyces sp. NBC_00140 TaxID=2975664 RepID=UPI0022522235|nr:FxsB family cyclophane-forming radical SAM/SPASM peptide maturase [Streptomyces sp. NBC_00140]MCX5330646.1 FxsB family radical SAM/SPASM domain protein [Streptomyces sp. NBC_00140]
MDLRRAGHRPFPFRQFVLKVHSRCNLGCQYCIIYQGQDGSWRDRPVRVTAEVMQHTAQRIAEHATAHELAEVRVDLHGGEPLLSGAETALAYVKAVRSALRGVKLWATVQTNGTLVSERTLDLLSDANIRVGLSLDGGTAALNRRRVDHAGRPAWPMAARAARLLADRPELYGGILCAIDIASDPVEVYSSLAELCPPGLDLLLPHANWSSPPPGLDRRPPWPARTAEGVPTPYGDWLAVAFDLWWDAARDERRPAVRLFKEIIALLLGTPSTIESVGLSPTCAVVVETDGAMEQIDSLRLAYDRATATGLDVFGNSFDEALDLPGVVARQLGSAGLAAECRACPVGRVCGGGNYGHRFHKGTGFHHPSVYCADLERLVRHVSGRLEQAMPRG